MALADQLVDDLLRRVRDQQGSTHPRATVRDLLDRAQVLYVRHTGTLIRERTFTATPTRALYPLDPTDTLRIVDIFVTDTQERLWPVHWQQLVHQFGQLWWRTQRATGPTTWANVGTTLFALWPAPTIAGGDIDLTIRDQRRPAALGDDTVEIELPAEYHPAMLDFCETVLLLRGRDAALAEALPAIEGQVA